MENNIGINEAPTQAIAKEMMTMKELCDYIALSRWTIMKMCKNFEIPFIPYGKNGRAKRFPRKPIDHWLASRMITPR